MKNSKTYFKCGSPLFHKQVTSHTVFPPLWTLTYNLHHSRGTTTDSLTAVIDWTGVGPSITRAQKTLAYRVTTIAVIITTRHKAATTCWTPEESYLTNCTHSSASQGDRWCCSVVWWLVTLLRWSVADVNRNLESWRKVQQLDVNHCIIVTNMHPRTNFDCFSTYSYRLCQLASGVTSSLLLLSHVWKESCVGIFTGMRLDIL